MFDGASAFNQNIGAWDTAAVTTTANMFNGATAFDNGGADGIKAWKTGLVTDMAYMFSGAAAFNQAIPTSGDKWDTAKVTDMSGMFNGASAFNKDIGTWDVSRVTSMAYMFTFATAFNNGGADGMKAWKVGSVTNNLRMFTNSGFTQSSLLHRQPCTIPATASATLNWPKCPFCPESGTPFADKTKLKAAVDACVAEVAPAP